MVASPRSLRLWQYIFDVRGWVTPHITASKTLKKVFPILMKFESTMFALEGLYTDVQDTFFDSGRKCVAMVTAYYAKK